MLQIDDLPTVGVETLRVRLDLLGGGAVQVDDIRVFDLAFDEAQRVRLARSLAAVEERLAAGDLGACAVELDRHWARFLDTFVTDAAAARSFSSNASCVPQFFEIAPASFPFGLPDFAAGAFNQQSDCTRVSLEMRFWRVPSA